MQGLLHVVLTFYRQTSGFCLLLGSMIEPLASVQHGSLLEMQLTVSTEHYLWAAAHRCSWLANNLPMSSLNTLHGQLLLEGYPQATHNRQRDIRYLHVSTHGSPLGTDGKRFGFCRRSRFRFAISALRFLSRRCW